MLVLILGVTHHLSVRHAGQRVLKEQLLHAKQSAGDSIMIRALELSGHYM